MQAIDLHLYLKCHSSTDVFQIFCQLKPTTWFLHKWDIGRKWVKQTITFLLSVQNRHDPDRDNCKVLNKAYPTPNVYSR